jgi:hypothetical protein
MLGLWWVSVDERKGPDLALQTLLPEVVVFLLLLEVERTRPLLRAFGLELHMTQ